LPNSKDGVFTFPCLLIVILFVQGALNSLVLLYLIEAASLLWWLARSGSVLPIPRQIFNPMMIFLAYAVFEIFHSSLQRFPQDSYILFLDAKYLGLLPLFLVGNAAARDSAEVRRYFRLTIICSGFISAALIVVASVGLPYPRAFGNRGDLGALVAVGTVLSVSSYLGGTTTLRNLIGLNGLQLFALLLLEGRTVFLELVAGLGTLIWVTVSKRWNLQWRRIAVPTALIFVTALAGTYTFYQRVDSEDILEAYIDREARVLALSLLMEIIDQSSIQEILFGYGPGSTFEGFARDLPKNVRRHVKQIKFSSGVNRYVSWGFHNGFIRLFLLHGLIGIVLVGYVFWKVLRLALLRSRRDGSAAISLISLTVLFLVANIGNAAFAISSVGGLFYFFFGALCRMLLNPYGAASETSDARDSFDRQSNARTHGVSSRIPNQGGGRVDAVVS